MCCVSEDANWRNDCGALAAIAGKPAPTGFYVVCENVNGWDDCGELAAIAGKPAPTGFYVVSENANGWDDCVARAAWVTVNRLLYSIHPIARVCAAPKNTGFKAA